MTDTIIAELTAKLVAIQQRIVRDRDHARQITDCKVRDDVEAYVKQLERDAEELAAQIAALKAANTTAEPEQDIAALKLPEKPDTEA